VHAILTGQLSVADARGVLMGRPLGTEAGPLGA
jgi:hypothetical protein